MSHHSGERHRDRDSLSSTVLRHKVAYRVRTGGSQQRPVTWIQATDPSTSHAYPASSTATQQRVLERSEEHLSTPTEANASREKDYFRQECSLGFLTPTPPLEPSERRNEASCQSVRSEEKETPGSGATTTTFMVAPFQQEKISCNGLPSQSSGMQQLYDWWLEEMPDDLGGPLQSATSVFPVEPLSFGELSNNTNTLSPAISETIFKEEGNRLHELLDDYHTELQSYVQGSAPSREWLATAKAINEVKAGRGDDFQQLTDAYWQTVLPCFEDLGGPRWRRADPTQMTPFEVLLAFKEYRRVPAPERGDMAAVRVLRFSKGVLAGRQASVAEAIRVLGEYNGPACNFLDLQECPSDCCALAETAGQLCMSLINLSSKIRSASSNDEGRKLEALATTLSDEYHSLIVLALLANARLAGNRTTCLQADPDTCRKAMAPLGFTKQQLEAWRMLRDHMQQAVLHASLAKNCEVDFLEGLLALTPIDNLSIDYSLKVLDRVSAVQAATVKIRALEMKTAISFLFCLTPVQATLLAEALAMIHSSSPEPLQMPSLADIMHFCHAVIVDEDLSRWMDD